LTINEGGKRQLRIKAPAKINIGLHILGKRPDGYHEIWTILQKIDLFDEILLQSAPDLAFSVLTSLPDIPADEHNLCVKAGKLLQEETQCKLGARLELNKVIPAGAGLGGGSSDAAAVLLALNRFWNTGLKRSVLMKLAAKLGSDVPFFLQSQCCIATGRGEILKPINPLITGPIILICPDVKVSTEWAYKNIDNYHLTSKKENIIFHGSLRESFRQVCMQEAFKNDFEPLVFDKYPLIEELQQNLLRSGAYYSSLSGSGSAVFGVFDSVAKAKEALKSIKVEGHIFLFD
jgi:4-diphosphocytidyl-2-C-methyl-D-erythritol kinase